MSRSPRADGRGTGIHVSGWEIAAVQRIITIGLCAWLGVILAIAAIATIAAPVTGGAS